MMISLRNTARSVAMGGVAAIALMVSAGCNSVQDKLLEPQQPQIINPGDIENPTGALGLYTGAIGRLRTALNGGNNNQETIWNFQGLMTDEFKSGDTFSQRNDADQRTTQSNDGVMGSTYNAVQQTRGRARDAIVAMLKYTPEEKTKIGEMYLVMGFMELTLGQAFCNGIPLGETVDNLPAYTKPLTTKEVFQTAIARMDTALTFLTGTDAQTVLVRKAVLLTKARALVNTDQYAAAAALVPAATVENTYQYLITYSQTTQSNEWWQMGTSTKRYTVGDSADITGTIKNHLPFATANDPRVKVAAVKGRSFDSATPFYEFTMFAREDPLPMLSGLDARLIEAEAKLQAGDFAGMMTILNSLRTAPPKIGNFTVTAMTALTTTPTTKDAAATLFFREKAFWQFGRGERFNDLRRLVRQYGRPQDQVWPSGAFHKNGNYGTNVNFPVPDTEKANTNFTGCIDRNA
ncbi:MAG TPA: hypothetical protein VIP11_26205 [Gemmatimonadaceae bacterium]